MTRSSPWKLLDLKPGSRTAYACNKNEQTTIKQQGGTCITITEKYGQYAQEVGVDPTGLGRWSWIRLTGDNDLHTTIIYAYSPCKPRKTSLLSTYAQQMRYWQLHGSTMCAKEKCRLDLLSFI